MKTFKNPLWDRQAPDPFITYDTQTGYYYCLFTIGNAIQLYRSKALADILKNDESIIVVDARTGVSPEGIKDCVWAPEMHKAPDNKWYIYSSASFSEDINNGEMKKRLFVLQSKTENPFDGFCFKGILDESKVGIDPTIYTDKNLKQYICWSSFAMGYDRGQVLEIAEMENPYTMGKKRSVIAYAEKEWELKPPYVGGSAINEGAFFLESAGRLFIIYSGNGAKTEDYGLGVIEYIGGDMCDAKSWKKHSEPVFVTGNGMYGPGHASFFKSPDGKEVWCAYHAMDRLNPDFIWLPRYINVQKFEFDETGYPVKSIPVGWNTPMNVPSGEI